MAPPPAPQQCPPPTNASWLSRIGLWFASLERTAPHNESWKIPEAIDETVQGGFADLDEHACTH